MEEENKNKKMKIESNLLFQNEQITENIKIQIGKQI